MQPYYEVWVSYCRSLTKNIKLDKLGDRVEKCAVGLLAVGEKMRGKTTEALMFLETCRSSALRGQR